MIFDEVYHLPRVTGANIKGVPDFNDSAHLAGVLEMFDHLLKVDCAKYVIQNRYKRHPGKIDYDCSLDQAILLMYGLFSQGRSDLVSLDYVDGKDIALPSTRGFVNIIQGKQATWLQKEWLDKEISINGWQKMNEPFRIIAICKVYGDEWLQKLFKTNPLLESAIMRYFALDDGAWRGEWDLAVHCVHKLREWKK
jgi:hypothetical protein